MAKEKNNELEKRNQAFLIYQDENGIARVNVRFEGKDVTQVPVPTARASLNFSANSSSKI